MQIKSINHHLSVTSQIMATDMKDIVKAGFKSVICNRPDGEAGDQPSFAEIEAAAAKARLQTRYIPIVSGQTTEADVTAFGKAVEELPGPILAFCRSGARSSMMWEMSQHVSKGVD